MVAKVWMQHPSFLEMSPGFKDDFEVTEFEIEYEVKESHVGLVIRLL